MSSQPPIAGMILAGGLSRRMGGGDKAMIEVDGQSLLDRVIERLQAHAPNARLLRTNLSHADEDRLRQLLAAEGVLIAPGSRLFISGALTEDDVATILRGFDQALSKL